MKQLHLIINSVISILLCLSCQSNKIQKLTNTSTDFTLSEDFKVVFLDSLAASESIITDTHDHFFERVSKAEMAIQMKENIDCESRTSCVEGYKSFLQEEVLDFTSQDVSKISEVFEEIKEMLHAVNPKLIDRDILLIKTRTKHYGESVYYTRENKIIIPQDVLNNYKKEAFKKVMLHEYFHVFSRFNKETREKLYALIGFTPINGRIILPLDLAKRKLLNPDGTTDYMINIDDQMAYPLITSSNEKFIESKPLFFNYLEFKLYSLLPGEDAVYHIGKEIPLQNAADFFTQIKDNTDYIIHPDEIIADNFIYTIYYLFTEKKLKDFSSQGMELITLVGKILKEHQ